MYHDMIVMMLLQFARDKYNDQVMNVKKGVNLENAEEVTEEAVKTTLRRGLSFYSTLQTKDGFGIVF